MSIEEFIKKANNKKKKLEQIPEVDIEDEYRDYVKSITNCETFKLTILGIRGFPDQTTLLKPGIIFFIEFKKKGKKLNKTQIPIKNLLIKLGFDYYVCDKKGQAIEILEHYIKKADEMGSR